MKNRLSRLISAPIAKFLSVLLLSVSASSATAQVANVLIIGAPGGGDPWNQDVVDKLATQGVTADFIDARSVTPTLSVLETYEAVLVYSDASFGNPSLLGDRLADYADGGGGVVQMTFSLGNVPLAGRWLAEGYNAIDANGQASGGQRFLGERFLPSHPVLVGVNNFSGGSSSFRNTGTFADDTIQIAQWDDGTPFAGEITGFGGRIIGLNFYPPSSDARSDFWNVNSDGALLLANSLNYVSNGLLEPLDVVVLFDTSGSLSGEAADFCADSSALMANLEAAGFDANVTIWGITQTPGGAWSCLTGTVAAELGTAVPNGGTLGGGSSTQNAEDWGNAVAIVAQDFPWKSNQRVVVPISDEGARLGDPVDSADAASIANAVQVCNANGVIAVGVAASGAGPAEQNFEDLANGTGGVWFRSTDANDGIAGAVLEAIGNVLRPDLVVQADPPSSQFDIGTMQTITWAVQNIGNRDVAATWTDRVYLSADGQVAGAIEIGSLPFSGTVLSGEGVLRELQVTIPVEAAGMRQLLIVADANSTVAESDETNNTLNAGPVDVVGPDLLVAGLTAPLSLELGSTTATTWTASNQGTGDAVGSWQERVWLSADSAIDGSDRLLTSVERTSLLAGESQVVAGDLVVPLSGDIIPGPYFLILETDPLGSVIELDETNNVAAVVGVEITAPPVPDLTVASFTAPSSAISGTQVTVQWTGRNDGDVAAAGPWVDRIFLSTDTVLDGSDLLIDEFGFAGSVDVGGTYSQSFVVNLPTRLGNQNLLLVVDGNDSIEELQGESNNVAVMSIEVQPMPIPDLVVTAVMSPASGILSGSQTEVTFDVRNDGTGATTVPTWSDEVFLSLDPSLDAGDTRIGTMTNPLFLPPGQSYRQRIQFNLPSDQAGQFWIIARADRSNQVAEGNESNNTAVAGPFTVELEPQPDLQVASVDGPSLAFSGEPLSVTWTEINSTDLPGTGGPTDASSWSSRVFLSENQTASITPGDIQIGTVSSGQGSPLAPGASFTLTRQVTLPTIISGDFFIKVEADSNDRVSEFGFEGNNIGVSDDTVTITQTPPIDLVATTLTATGEALPGHVVTLNYEAANFGAPPQTSISWIDAIYLSADGTFDPSTDTRIATVSRSANQSGIEPYAPTTTARLANSLAPGSYTLFVRVDDNNSVFEGTAGEENNVFQAGPALVVEGRFADLQPALTVPTGEAFPPGRTVDISWIVTNEGDAITPVDSWFDAVLFSTDDVVDGSDQTLTSVDRSGVLPPGAGYNREASIELPLAAPGSYFLILVSDRGNAVFEGPGDTETNTSIIPIEISNVASDLVASSASGPSVGVAGRPVAVTWTVTNQGSADTNRTTWIDIVEIAPEGSPTSVIASATAPREGVLAPSGTYNGTANITLPISAQGNFIARVRTDSLDRVFEQSEANNESITTAFAVTLPDDDGDGEPDIANLVAAAPTGPSMAQTGDGITVSWSVSNTGDGTTSTNQWTDTVFLSTDATLSGDDITLGSRSRIGALDSGASYSASINATLLTSLTPGDYFFIVQTDTAAAVFEDGQTADNIAASATPVTIEPFAAPNLVALAVSTEPEVATGQLLEITWSARNDGEGAPRESTWSDAVWLSRDQFLGGNDIRLGSVTRSGTLAPGETYEQTTSFRVPSGIAGPYFVLAQIDSGFRVNEDGREDDNVVAGSSLIDVTIPDPADLVVASVSPPSMAMLGEQATFTWEVANADDAASPVTGSWEDSVFLSEDEVWDIDDAFVGRVTTRATSPLDPGMSVMGSITAPVPGVRPGEYFVIVRSDSRNLIPETDDLNNDGVSVGTVSVEATPLTLGVPFAGDFPSGVDRYFQVDVPAGETLRFTYTHDDPNAFTELYVAFERVPTIGDFDRIFASPGASEQRVEVPFSDSGTYFVLVRTTRVGTSTSGSVEVVSLPFQLADAFPSEPGAGVVTFTASGARLLETTDIYIVLDGNGQRVDPLAWQATEATTLQAAFDLTGLEGAAFRLVAESTSGPAILVDDFMVVPVRRGPVSVEVTGLRAVRPGGSLGGQIALTNLGNVDAPAVRFSFIGNADAIESGFIDGGVPVQLEPVSLNGDVGYDTTIAGLNAGSRTFFDYGISIRRGAPNSLDLFAAAEVVSAQALTDRYAMIYFDSAMLRLRELGLTFETDDGILINTLDLPPDFFLEVTDEFRSGFADALTAGIEQQLASDRVLPPSNALRLNSFGRGTSAENRRPDFCENLEPGFWGRLAQNASCELVGQACFGAGAAAAAKFGGGCFITGPWGSIACGALGGAASFLICEFGCSELIRLLDDEVDVDCCGNPCKEGCDAFPGNECNEPDDPLGGCRTEFFDTDGDGCDDAKRICPTDPFDVFFGRGRIVPAVVPCGIPIVRPVDPNELAGPEGAGEERWVGDQVVLPYRALFENLPDATAPATTVRVEIALPPAVALGTLRLSDLGFADLVLEVPSNRITLQDSVNTLSPQGTPLRVDIFGGVNPSTDPPVAFWVLQAIDESTGEPPLDPFDGFLPPNDPETGSGEGFIDFSLRPAPGVVTGDVIELQAEIIFDQEEPILTNTVFNTIDADAPISSLGTLPLATLNPEIPLTFSGTDPAGAGLLGVQVLVSEDNGPLTVFVPTTQDGAAVFEGEPGRVYRFVSQAIDAAGNVEAITTAPSAVVAVPTLELAVESDTGVIGDGLTLDRTPTFDIVSVPFSAVPIALSGSGVDLVGTIFTDAIGRGSYTVPNGSALPDGTYMVGTDNEGVFVETMVEIAPAGMIEGWASTAMHGSAGVASIPISHDDTMVEPRSSGVSRVEINFTAAIDPASFTPEAVSVNGLDATNQPVDLSGVAVTTSLTGDSDVGVITFTPALPDVARYCISVNGLLDAGGNEILDDTRVQVIALRGDVNGDRRVNGADVAFARAIRDQVGGATIDLLEQDQVRSDAQADGRLNGADVAFVRSFNRNDARLIGEPCPPLRGQLVASVDGLVETDVSEEFGGTVVRGGTVASNGLNGTNAADAESDASESDTNADDSSRWQDIDTPFLPADVVVRLDPERFVVGSPAGVNLTATLAGGGVAADAVTPLGYTDWIVVEAADSNTAAKLRETAQETGAFTAPVLRDAAGEYLIPMSSVLVQFVEGIPVDMQQQIVEAELGDAIGGITVSGAAPSMLIVDLLAIEGEDAMNAANRLSARDEVSIAEPDFVVFSNRISAGTTSGVEVELTEPMALELPAEVAADARIDAVILDDGLLLTPEMQAGRTVFGGINTMGEPETLADVFGQAVFGGLVDATDRSTAISIRSMASLNSAGRSVSTTLAMAEALEAVREFSPRIVVSSAATGYRSTLLDAIEADLASSGITFIRPAAAMLGEGEPTPAAKGGLRIPLTAFEPAALDGELRAASPTDTATRIGQVAAMMLAADRFGDRPRPELAEATLRVLDTAEGREMLAADGPEVLVFEIERMADRLSIDLDGDGRITTTDAAAFIQRFGNGDESLDLDASGRVDQGDLLVFMRRFEAYRDN